MRRPTLAPVVIALAVLLIPAAYMAVYYAMLKDKVSAGYPEFFWVPEYRVGGKFAETLFVPANQLDRRVRSEYWKPPRQYGF
jgi:hypothetical protein